MIKKQLIQARDLIKQKRYDDARAILQRINHPTARDWLTKLNKLAPPPPATSGQAKPAPDAGEVKAQLLHARDLIRQKNYDGARSLLEQIDHPAAKAWLGKLTALIVAQGAPSAPPSAPSHDEILRMAQEALLMDQYDKAREMLEPLQTPEAAFWREKTGMTRFRSYENIWLDVFRYTLPPDAAQDPAGWTCSTCGRGAHQALACPQRDQNPCPVKISTRTIEEPRRLALLLQALYLNQTEDIQKILIHIEPARLTHWKIELNWQLEHMNRIDVRRSVVERAIALLDRHIQQHQANASRSAPPGTPSRKPARPVRPPVFPQADDASESAQQSNSLAALREAASGGERGSPEGILRRIKRFFIN
jgi:hypothetical protein